MNSMEHGEDLPERVKVSLGDLPLSADLTVSLINDRKLQFTWAPDHLETASGKDQLMLLVYHPESRTAIYEIHGAFRETGTQVISLVSDFIEKTIHVYAAFVAADRSRQSESVYFEPILVV